MSSSSKSNSKKSVKRKVILNSAPFHPKAKVMEESHPITLYMFKAPSAPIAVPAKYQMAEEVPTTPEPPTKRLKVEGKGASAADPIDIENDLEATTPPKLVRSGADAMAKLRAQDMSLGGGSGSGGAGSGSLQVPPTPMKAESKSGMKLVLKKVSKPKPWLIKSEADRAFWDEAVCTLATLESKLGVLSGTRSDFGKIAAANAQALLFEQLGN